MSEKPKHFLIFKVIGCIMLIIAIIGIFKVVKGFNDFESNNFLVGSILSTFGLFIGLSCLLIGFMPEMSRLSTKSTKYILNENKDDLKEITETTTEITKESIAETVKAVKEGLDSEIYCKYCGEKIDNDSLFCKHCGKKL